MNRILKASCLLLVLLSFVVPAAASAGDQLYLVHFEATEAAAPTSREQAIELLEGLILPSLDMLAEDGKIQAGGLFVGARAGVFILKAESHEAATAMVRAVPAWGVWDWKVEPLESFESRSSLEKKVVGKLKAE